MSILEHVGELGTASAKSCAALVVTTVVAFSVLYDPVLEFVLRSYCAACPRACASAPRARAAAAGWPP